MSEFEKSKNVIKEYFEKAQYGLFFSRNTVGDNMRTIYAGERITIDICFFWEYFEVFGLTETEKEELAELYVQLKEQKNVGR